MVIKRVVVFVYRLLINPCYGCVREGDCELYTMSHGFCGDRGLNYYEKRVE